MLMIFDDNATFNHGSSASGLPRLKAMPRGSETTLQLSLTLVMLVRRDGLHHKKPRKSGPGTPLKGRDESNRSPQLSPPQEASASLVAPHLRKRLMTRMPKILPAGTRNQGLGVCSRLPKPAISHGRKPPFQHHNSQLAVHRHQMPQKDSKSMATALHFFNHFCRRSIVIKKR